MDIKNALHTVEQHIYNAKECKFLQASEIVLKGLEDFRRFKRFNQAHIKQLMLNIAGNGIVHGASFSKRQYFDDQHEFRIFYSQMEWEGYYGEPRKCNQSDQFTVRNEDLSGEAVYQAVLARIENYKEYQYKPLDIEDYKTFYAQLTILCGEHKCSKDALETLFRR